MIMTLKKVFSDESLKKNRDIAIIAVLTILLGFGTVTLAGKLVTDYQSAQKIKAQMADMRSELKDWETKSSFLNDQQFRPVPADKVDSVQADIMLALQGSQLKLTEYKAIASANSGKNKEGEPFKAFNMSFTGTYENTITFLENFHARDALIQLIQVEMAPKSGAITTKIAYRIYTK